MQKSSGTAFSVTCDVIGRDFGLFTIQLFDASHTMVSQRRCRSNSTARFSVASQGEYMITVTPCQTKDDISPLGASRWTLLGPSSHSAQFFRFNIMTRRPPDLVGVGFSLTDAYYSNLPINKGDLKLWRNIS